MTNSYLSISIDNIVISSSDELNNIKSTIKLFNNNYKTIILIKYINSFRNSPFCLTFKSSNIEIIEYAFNEISNYEQNIGQCLTILNQQGIEFYKLNYEVNKIENLKNEIKNFINFTKTVNTTQMCKITNNELVEFKKKFKTLYTLYNIKNSNYFTINGIKIRWSNAIFCIRFKFIDICGTYTSLNYLLYYILNKKIDKLINARQIKLIKSM